MRLTGTFDEVSAARAECGPERVRDCAQVGDFCLDLGEFHGRALPQPFLSLATVLMTAGFQQASSSSPRCTAPG